MFSATTALTTLLALATTSTLAAPAPAPAAAVADANFQNPAPFDFISLAAAGKNVAANAMVKRNIGGVRMSDGAGFTGHVWYGIYPLNTCIDLRS